jgi:hypothetical protein
MAGMQKVETAISEDYELAGVPPLGARAEKSVARVKGGHEVQCSNEEQKAKQPGIVFPLRRWRRTILSPNTVR